MSPLEVARLCVQHNEIEGAVKAYTLVIRDDDSIRNQVEASLFLLEADKYNTLAYSVLITAYRNNMFKSICLGNMVEYALKPYMEEMIDVYETNYDFLCQYPYISNIERINYEDLPIRFFKIHHDGYIKFNIKNQRFGDMFKLNAEPKEDSFHNCNGDVIHVYDVFMEYDFKMLSKHSKNVVLHYSSYAEFMSYLQIVDLTKYLRVKPMEIVFEDNFVSATPKATGYVS